MDKAGYRDEPYLWSRCQQHHPGGPAGPRTAQANQRRLVTDLIVCRSFGELLPFLQRQIRSLEAEIAALIDSDPLWQTLDAAFRTIKGVADRTVARLFAELPEIGTLSN